MIQTKMKALVFAKKLRAQIEVLKKQKAAEERKFNADFAKWQKELEAWTKANVLKRVRAITKNEVKEHHRYRDDRGFSTSAIFAGCPTAPEFPKQAEDRIKKCRTLLRQLALTGQEMVHIDTSDVKKIFGDEDDD